MLSHTILLSLITSDSSFHHWCERQGIKALSVSLRTTPESVAGRGVFALGTIAKDSAVLRIPETVVLDVPNAKEQYPNMAKELKEKIQQANEDFEEFCYEYTTEHVDWWQAELAMYALAAQSADDGFWSPWISAWQRDDPVQSILFQSKFSTVHDDESIFDNCVQDMQNLLPRSASGPSKAAIERALTVRIGRMKELQTLFEMTDEQVAMCGLLTSRSISLGPTCGHSGVIPFLDMVNHSTRRSNVSLRKTKSVYELYATRNVDAGEELFMCYDHVKEKSSSNTCKNSLSSEDRAAWMLVQWGIPEETHCSGSEEK